MSRIELTEEQRAFLIKVAHGMRRSDGGRQGISDAELHAAKSTFEVDGLGLWKWRYLPDGQYVARLTAKGIQILGLDNQSFLE